MILAARPSRRQDELRAQHRRARGRPGQEERRHLQPRDEQGAAGPAAALSRSPTSTPSACGRGFLEEMDFARIAPAMNALSEAPIYIDDTPNITTMELRTKARRLQAEVGLDLVDRRLPPADAVDARRPGTRTASRRCRRSRAGSRRSRASSRCRSSRSRSCRASRRCASRRSRVSRTCASPGRSSRTPTWCCSCGVRRSAARDDQDADGEVVKLKLAKHRNGPTGEIELWFKKRQTRFVGYAGERYAEAS